MNFLKQNPVFSALLVLFGLAFIAGVVLIFQASGQVAAAEKKAQRAEASLRGALALEPAPTPDNVAAAKENVAKLKASLVEQIEATEGKTPDLLQARPPATGTELLFQLEAYKNGFTREAKRTVPINVPDNLIEEARKQGGDLPAIALPEGFAFGFGRYINSGEPPDDADVPVVFHQKEILTYVLEKLIATRPISIVSVSREPVELKLLPLPAQKANSGSRDGPVLEEDEFRIGTESARVAGAVETLPFRIVFTGFTENLRSFLKAIEGFEIPLVVRSVEVAPVESSVRVGSERQSDSIIDIFSVFGASSSSSETSTEESEEEGKEPIVAENESQFTVVLEFIEVTIDEETAEEDLG